VGSNPIMSKEQENNMLVLFRGSKPILNNKTLTILKGKADKIKCSRCGNQDADQIKYLRLRKVDIHKYDIMTFQCLKCAFPIQIKIDRKLFTMDLINY
jgi:late competence protein required for DNA uptake (superfamily II DNA/RNA helicase)